MAMMGVTSIVPPAPELRWREARIASAYREYTGRANHQMIDTAIWARVQQRELRAEALERLHGTDLAECAAVPTARVRLERAHAEETRQPGLPASARLNSQALGDDSVGGSAHAQSRAKAPRSARSFEYISHRFPPDSMCRHYRVIGRRGRPHFGVYRSCAPRGAETGNPT